MAEAQKEAEREAEIQASKAETPVRQSYADQATSHKSAFFSRASASREPQVDGQHVRDNFGRDGHAC